VEALTLEMARRDEEMELKNEQIGKLQERLEALERSQGARNEGMKDTEMVQKIERMAAEMRTMRVGEPPMC
jgi:hypothetical protein